MSKRFVFNITDDQAALLEAHRAKVGARSMAEALRWIIEALREPTKEELREFTKEAIKPFLATGYAGHRVQLETEPAQSAATHVTIGPVTPKPGDRLKKGK